MPLNLTAVPTSPHFSPTRSLFLGGPDQCRAGWWRRLRCCIWFFGSVGLLVMPRCRRAAAMRVRWARRAARPHSSAAGQAEAMAILMRRTVM